MSQVNKCAKCDAELLQDPDGRWYCSKCFRTVYTGLDDIKVIVQPESVAEVIQVKTVLLKPGEDFQ